MRLLLLSFLITSLSFAQQSSFTVTPTTACVGSAVSYFGIATPGFTVLSWNWNFGDGNSSTVQNPTHIYTLAGPKTITLTIQYEGVSPSPFSQQSIQVDPKPNASFTTDVSGCSLPVSVSFSNTSTGATSYAWTFGNGNTSTAASPPAQSYGSAGTVNPQVIITNSFGCKDTASQSLVINNFQAGIQAPTNICRGMTATFDDNSTAGVDSWSWSFPGANPLSSTEENPNVNYAVPGSYTVTLTSMNSSSGCSSTTSVQVNVLASPQPLFTVDPPAGCAPETMTFTNTSPPGTTFTWNFGDGSVASGQNPPPHTYTANGTYYPSLIMTDNNGCTGAYVYNAISLGLPTAGFMIDQMAGCTPLTVHFTDTSGHYGDITSWFWDFGNGNTSTEQNPTEVFDVGIYDITLTITAGGCTSTITYDEMIMVGDTFDVSFDVIQPSQCSSSLISMTSTTDVSPYDAEVNYLWVPCGTGKDNLVPYKVDTGDVNIYLTIVFRGCNSFGDPYPITVLGPRGGFRPSDSLCMAALPATVQTDDFTFAGATSDDIDMTWTWGDGSPPDFLDDAQLQDADKGSMSHVYNDYGIYTITQITYNHTTGCRDSVLHVIEIGDVTPVFSLSTNDTVCPNTVVSLNAGSSVTNNSGGISSYVWTWDNGTILPDTTASAPLITDTLIEARTYTFHLQVSATAYAAEEFQDCANTIASTSCTRDTTIHITVITPPLANFIADDSTGCSPFAVTFTNNSTLQDNGVAPTSFEFTFPDGTQTTSSVSTPVTHTFNGVGVFDISMIASDPYGCQSEPAHSNIYITKPVAAFTLSENVTCENDSVLAINTSSDIVSWSWSLDESPDPETDDSLYMQFDETTDLVTTHFDHLIGLIVADSNGCTDTLVQPLIVSTPIAMLDYLLDGASTNENGAYTCPPVFAEFTNESLTYGGIESYSWTFGDGNLSIEEDPDNTYVFAGTYSATFAFVDEYGCPADTTLIDFLTIGGPQAHPLWTQDTSMCARVVHFDIGPDAVGVARITWNLNDGNVVLDSVLFDHLYEEGHTYNPSCTIVDTDGCQVFYPLSPVNIPVVDINAYFTYSPTSIDLGQPVVFTDQSTSAAPIANWTWDLSTIPVFSNDGSPVANQYYISGSYPITLAIVDVHGCVDTFSLEIFVEPDFEMPNVFTGNGDGINDVFSMPNDIFDHFDIVIVNRWGNTIHEALEVTGTIIWDGRTDTGEMCSPGVYFYIIKGSLKNGTTFSKHGFLELFSDK